VNQDRDDEFNNRKLLLSVGKGSFPGFIHKPTWTGFWSTNVALHAQRQSSLHRSWH
jgi:hypothetical protein